MGKSSIQWTDFSFNAWEGCTKVAPECKNCYAETLVDHRFGRAKWGKGQPRRRTSTNLWKQPLAWNRFVVYECPSCGQSHFVEIGKDDSGWECLCSTGGTICRGPRRPRVFCLSLGDWLDEEVPIEWLADLIKLIHNTPNLDWQLLTKRPQNWRERVNKVWNCDETNGDQGSDFRNALSRWFTDETGAFMENVWIGVSAGADIEAALNIPAKIHFLSCEPMLKPLDTSNEAYRHFDWIIFGGESGKNARPCDVGWIRQGVKFCKAGGIAAFVKQFGARPFENYEGTDPTPQEEAEWHRNGWCKISFADGSGRPPVWNKNYRLRDSHGGDWSEWPEDLRIREFP